MPITDLCLCGHALAVHSGACARRACGCRLFRARDDAPAISPRRAPQPITPDRRGAPITRKDPTP